MASNRPAVKMCENLMCVLKEQDYQDQLQKLEEFAENLEKICEDLTVERDFLENSITKNQETIAELQCELRSVEDSLREKVSEYNILDRAYTDVSKAFKATAQDLLHSERHAFELRNEKEKMKKEQLEANSEHLALINKLGNDVVSVRKTLEDMIEECKNKPPKTE